MAPDEPVLNLFLIFIPLAWVSHWEMVSWGHDTTFARKTRVSSLRVGTQR